MGEPGERQEARRWPLTGGGEDLAVLARQVLSGMAVLAKSVRIYSTENAVFLKQLQAALDPLNRAVALAQRLDFEVLESGLKVNGAAVALDHVAHETLKGLAHAFKAHGIAALVAAGPVSAEDLRNFFFLFTKDSGEPPPEDGLPGHALHELRVRRAGAVGRPAAADVAESPEQLKQGALKAYARAVLWADLQTKALHERRKDDVLSVCPRVAQDLVEHNSRLRSTLLPYLVNGEGPRALSHHLANTAVLAATFGERLGLSRPQLRDLVVTSLSAEATLVHVPPELWMPADPARLPAEHEQLRVQAFAEESQRALAAEPFRKLEQLRALAVGQMHESHLIPLLEPSGATAYQHRGDSLFVSRVLAIASHYDAMTSPSGERPAYSQEQALSAMWGPLRYRFDADLLWAFVRLMARVPIKACPRAAGGAFDG